MDVVIRPARLEDAEAVVRVHERASAAMFEELIGRRFDDVLPFGERLEDCRRALDEQSGSAQTIVAQRGDEIVGMASWRLAEDGQGELEDLHVVPEAWGTGVGTRLLDAAVDALSSAGAEAAFLWVGEVNARARRFYERERWEHDGTRRPSAFGPIELRYRLIPSRRHAST